MYEVVDSVFVCIKNKACHLEVTCFTLISKGDAMFFRLLFL